MIVERIVCGRTRTNIYVVARERGGPCLIVDAGVGATKKVAVTVGINRLTPEAILLTHGHPDHIWSARELSERYAVDVRCHAADWRWFDDPATGGYLPLLRWGGQLLGKAKRLRPARLHQVEGHETIHAAGMEILALHTPGHTPGGVCYQLDGHLFTGDTLFADGPGHTGYPGAERRALRRSVRAQLADLPDDLRVLPGHGPETTMSSVRGWLERFVHG